MLLSISTEWCDGNHQSILPSFAKFLRSNKWATRQGWMNKWIVAEAEEWLNFKEVATPRASELGAYPTKHDMHLLPPPILWQESFFYRTSRRVNHPPCWPCRDILLSSLLVLHLPHQPPLNTAAGGKWRSNRRRPMVNNNELCGVWWSLVPCLCDLIIITCLNAQQMNDLLTIYCSGSELIAVFSLYWIYHPS